MSLPVQFAGMEAHRQWMLWKLLPPKKPGGKKEKVPVSPSGVLVSPHLPENQYSYVEACAYATAIGVNVGFVQTDNDPYFFVDVDNAVGPDGKWTAIALAVFAAYPGAAFELSQSGKGFHLIGSTSLVVPHTNKRTDLDIELYVTKRFIALTFNTGAGTGNTENDLTSHYVANAAWWPVSEGSTGEDGDFDWSVGADPEWCRMADEEIIERLLGQKPSMTPGVATTRQLWEADADALGQCYPSPSGEPFDHSSADLALCNALAFWCGKDPVCMDRLFRASALFREDKWEARPTIVMSTLKAAIGGCSAVYKGPPVPEPSAEITPDMVPEGVAIQTGYQFMSPDLQLQHFAGCVYVWSRHEVWVPSGDFLNPVRFNAVYGGKVFALDAEGKTTRKAFEAFTESQVIKWPTAHVPAFRPRDTPGMLYTEGGRVSVNTYTPANPASIEGDVTPFLDFLGRILPVELDRVILVNYFARQVQSPGFKFQYALWLQGAEGNGKTFLCRVLAAAVGERYVIVPNASDVANKFNASFQFALLAIIEEARGGNGEVLEALKPMVTNTRLEFQGKGTNQVTAEACFNMLFTSNHKDALSKHRGDRRFAPLFTAQQCPEDIIRCGMGGDFFPKLWTYFNTGGAAHITHWLQHFPIDPQYDPAGACQRAPLTSSTVDAISHSATPAEYILTEAIAEGRAGFCGGWVSSIRMAALFEERRARADRAARRAALEGLGFVPHPGLPGGRATAVVMSEGGHKPILYVKVGSIAHNNLTGADVVLAYEKAQAPDGAILPPVEALGGG